MVMTFYLSDSFVQSCRDKIGSYLYTSLMHELSAIELKFPMHAALPEQSQFDRDFNESLVRECIDHSIRAIEKVVDYKRQDLQYAIAVNRSESEYKIVVYKPQQDIEDICTSYEWQQIQRMH